MPIQEFLVELRRKGIPAYPYTDDEASEELDFLSKAVPDSSVVIALSALGYLGMLKRVFSEVLTSRAVYEESYVKGRGLIGERELLEAVNAGLIVVKDVGDRLLIDALLDALARASETETKVIDLANWINELTGNEAGTVFKPRRDWDKVVKRRASIGKARKILGYELGTDIKIGLRKTYEWFRENWEHIRMCESSFT